MNFKVLMVYLLVFISVFGLILKHDGMHEVWAQAAETTANVTISGYLDSIIVGCIPVSFSNSSNLVFPDGGTYPKVEDCHSPNITIGLSPMTNVAWYFYMNATDLIDDQGHEINITDPNYLLQVDTDCGGVRTLSPINLDYSLVPICDFSTTGIDNPIDALEVVGVSFFLTVPDGTYNNTFKGSFSIWINSTASTNDVDWAGVDQLNVTVQKSYELYWTLAPISFGTLSPRLDPYNATNYLGFPTNLTVGPKTNIFVDLYINGTDLVKEGDPAEFIAIGDNGNVTYSNATGGAGNEGSNEPTDWPNSTKELDYTLPIDVPAWGGGDFSNWYMIGNSSHVFSYWNMTVLTAPPLERPIVPGIYVANLTAKIIDAGFDPTP